MFGILINILIAVANQFLLHEHKILYFIEFQKKICIY